MIVRNYYDPNVVSGQAPIEPVVKFSADNPPKSKEDWNKLAQDDPTTWISLTQSNTDRLVREKRELEEKFSREQQEKNNLSVELNRYKSNVPVNPVVPDGNNKVPYGTNNFPKTQEEWDGLFLENPTFATDLRQYYNNKNTSINTDFQRAQTDAKKVVQADHPDMYQAELDVNGNPRKDEQGKLILQKDSNGEPIFNPNSEKGKLWEQIYKESFRSDGTNPLLNLPNAPILMKEALEARLIRKGQSMIQSNEPPKQNQVAAPGVLPPTVTAGSYKTKEEQFHVEKQIQRGLYKDASDYFKTRDGGSQAVYDSNRRPDFSRK